MRRVQRKRERQKGSRVCKTKIPRLWKARSIGTGVRPLVTENFPPIRVANGRSALISLCAAFAMHDSK
jgi:hypothetical protein